MVYFAADDAEKTAKALLEKANNWYNGLYSNGYLDRLKSMWAAYHGAYFDSNHRISFGGEQGELSQLAVNHLRNLARHIHTMVVSNRPALQARATNTDYKSQAQTKLANDLLDYYLREKRLEKFLESAVESAIVQASGYIKMGWNSTSGEIYDYNEELGIPIYEGDVEFTNLSPLNVVFDPTKEDTNFDWVLCRTFKNKYDISTKYPEFKDRIEGMKTKSELFNFRFDNSPLDETDDIPVYEFFHKRTESMPEGRYLLFLDEGLPLMDTPLPYRDIPIYRISPSTVMGTPYGYTDLFDVLPIQEAINVLYSTIFTNQYTFGVQSIYVPRGADINIKSIEGGLNIIEGNSMAGKPEPINFTQTPPEVFNFIKMLESSAETISGVNSVARGNPEASLKSGAALALVQSMALQFISGLQQGYVQLLEDVGTGLINMLKDFADVPRIAMIAGKDNRTYVKTEFKGDDLSQINRVIVDVGNPIAKCLAKGTKVLMFNGDTKLVEDITIGDKVMGPDSKPRTVSNVTVGVENMYEITSKVKSKDILYGANESHILTLKYCSDDKRYNVKKGDVIDISIRDYLKLPNRHRRLLQGFTVSVEYPEKNLEIPPYILGCWLGDGHPDNTAITTMDNEIKDAWVNYASNLNLEIRIQNISESNKAKTYFITSGEKGGKNDRNQFKEELKLLELIKNKHIPRIYKASSSNQRLELLAGLLDTDGTLNKNGTFVITQKSKVLANDILLLARSLGFMATIKLISASCQTGYVGEYYRVTIGGDVYKIPTKLERKQAKETEKYRNWLNYGIEVKHKGLGNYYGFTLEEEPHFVLGNYTITHNTTSGKLQIASELIQYGIIKTPEQYMSILSSGRLDAMTDDSQREMLLIKSENEKLTEGEYVPALAIDQHATHIKGHRAALADTELRQNPEIVSMVLRHIEEHIMLLETVKPSTLAIIGEQPLQPANPPQGAIPPENLNQSAGTPASQVTEPMTSGALPGMPNMPQVPEGVLPNPELQQQALGNVQG